MFCKQSGTILPFTKSFEIINVESLSYQALGTYFKSYKALSNLKTKSGCVGSINLGVVQHTLPLQ